jgi:serine/threonine protein phosphatase PrpC
MTSEQLESRIGFASEKGKRETNDDYAAARVTGNAMRETLAAIADGMGGGPGGRLAAETTVRGFIDGYLSLPGTLGVDRAAARSLAAMNRWVFAQGRQDAQLRNMATTLSALLLRGRHAHVVHVGDTRIYRLRDSRLQRLTEDHAHTHPDMRHVLYRAVGLEDTVRADYARHDLKPHDRFLLCSDGVHGVLAEERLRQLLAERAAPEEGARRIVEAALAAGSQDNATALVLDVVAVPAASRSDLELACAALPVQELSSVGESVDGFRLLEVISDGRYSRLFRAEDTQEPREVTLKFPHPRVTSEAAYRRAFVREAWVAAQVKSPFVTEVLELPPGRQTRLYSVMPYYRGETLEQRLRRPPAPTLAEGVDIGMQLAKAVYALNRLRIIHRDIKPENVLLVQDEKSPKRSVKLLDLGVARLPGMEEEAAAEEIPGTPSYMAPELFDGQPGDERSDVYALGVTLYRLFSAGHYPYGEVEAFSRPRFTRRAPLSRYRPDLPVWLDARLARATAVDPDERYGDAMELAFDLEHGLAHGAQTVVQRRSLYDRDPVRFWQAVAVLLALALILALSTK